MEIDERIFNASSIDDWKYVYIDAEEPMPTNILNSRELFVKVSYYVDVDLVGSIITRHYHTDILIYLQNTPILWYRKRNIRLKSSSFVL